MSGLMREVAAAASMVTSSTEQNLLMLRHHLNEAFLFCEELGLKSASHDLCRMLRMIED
ncbi:hypothetical protein [Novosphingobium sp. B1]|uniref:hypothetical protein n=1 Tax=Novosphingobium sp. B1 TaxID=1938756 RepID=UPI0009D8590C|nr:hypothetical protein [Novosphingobium sp. B1]SMC40328.1 hypothetical protein SAMN06272759_102226 [Novosphingobium sp. B1]